MKIVDTYQAVISLGLKEGYEGKTHKIKEVYQTCQEYCNTAKLAVTITPTTFIYVDGSEDGCLVGLINYPRFPSTPEDIKDRSIHLAVLLMTKFKQNRVSVICTDKTYMLENDLIED